MAPPNGATTCEAPPTLPSSADTTTINALSSKLREKDAVVLTGESESGKTVASMLGSTRNKNCCGVYLSATDVDLNGSDQASLSWSIWSGRSPNRPDTSSEPDFDKIEGAILSIILDELGSHREVLRTYLRLTSEAREVVGSGVGALRRRRHRVWRRAVREVRLQVVAMRYKLVQDHAEHGTLNFSKSGSTTECPVDWAICRSKYCTRH